MVAWTDAWLEKNDANKVEVKLWVTRKDVELAHCNICHPVERVSTQGLQSLSQHSRYGKHKTISTIRFGDSVYHLKSLSLLLLLN